MNEIVKIYLVTCVHYNTRCMRALYVCSEVLRVVDSKSEQVMGYQYLASGRSRRYSILDTAVNSLLPAATVQCVLYFCIEACIRPLHMMH